MVLDQNSVLSENCIKVYVYFVEKSLDKLVSSFGDVRLNSPTYNVPLSSLYFSWGSINSHPPVILVSAQPQTFTCNLLCFHATNKPIVKRLLCLTPTFSLYIKLGLDIHTLYSNNYQAKSCTVHIRMYTYMLQNKIYLNYFAFNLNILNIYKWVEK